MGCTKLGRLVQQGKIKSLEHIYLFSIPIKEYQIVEHFIGPALTDEVMKIMPVQKQTSAGQRMRFKAFVVVGDSNGHIGLGVKACKEVAHSIQGSMILAKLNIVPVRRTPSRPRFTASAVPCTFVSSRRRVVRVSSRPVPLRRCSPWRVSTTCTRALEVTPVRSVTP